MIATSPDTKLVPIAKVPAMVENITGTRPNLSTCHRWRQRGIRGVRLKTQFVGGSRKTSELWLRQFFADVTAAADGEEAATSLAVGIPTDSARQQHEEAERLLTADGM